MEYAPNTAIWDFFANALAVGNRNAAAWQDLQRHRYSRLSRSTPTYAGSLASLAPTPTANVDPESVGRAPEETLSIMQTQRRRLVCTVTFTSRAPVVHAQRNVYVLLRDVSMCTIQTAAGSKLEMETKLDKSWTHPGVKRRRSEEPEQEIKTEHEQPDPPLIRVKWDYDSDCTTRFTLRIGVGVDIAQPVSSLCFQLSKLVQGPNGTTIARLGSVSELVYGSTLLLRASAFAVVNNVHCPSRGNPYGIPEFRSFPGGSMLAAMMSQFESQLNFALFVNVGGKRVNIAASQSYVMMKHGVIISAAARVSSDSYQSKPDEGPVFGWVQLIGTRPGHLGHVRSYSAVVFRLSDGSEINLTLHRQRDKKLEAARSKYSWTLHAPLNKKIQVIFHRPEDSEAHSLGPRTFEVLVGLVPTPAAKFPTLLQIILPLLEHFEHVR
ncbi:hypothetical protein C8R47DRAFT_1081965 [Mycena vitilis]|nr:hypothetical protein C8R47DRAFT_1081965 [Mycena vitilis]